MSNNPLAYHQFPLCAMTGYQEKTTFWNDFCIADVFGKAAVQDTYDRAFNEWKANTEYVTELVMVLNWKSWEHSDRGNMALCQLYCDLYEEAHDWCLDNLKGDDLTYYLQTTD